MNTAFHFSVLALCLLALPGHAMIAHEVRLGVTPFFIEGFNDLRSDQMIDGTTVRATLTDNFEKKRWELRFRNYLSGSLDLTDGSDVTLGTDIHLEIQKFPNGNPQGVRWIYIQGMDVQNFKYSDATDMIELDLRPVGPTRTTGHPDNHTAALGIDFYYGGMPTPPITYSPPVISGTVFLDDIERPQHSSSQLLWGTALRVDGIQGEEARFDFLFGSSFAERWSIDLDDFRGYLDGGMPAIGFSSTLPTTPASPVDMGIAGEEFRMIRVLNLNFSARDIQAGIFREAPRFTDIQVETTGVRLYWNADTNRTYTLEQFPALGEPKSILGTNLTGPQFLDTTASTNGARFYRLLEE